jgi:hypothetical protein
LPRALMPKTRESMRDITAADAHNCAIYASDRHFRKIGGTVFIE